MKVGLNLPAISFTEQTFQSDGETVEKLIPNRFITPELIPTYNFSGNINIGMYYIYGLGLEKEDQARQTHFISLRANFNQIHLLRSLSLPPENTFLTFFIGPQMYISNFGTGLMKYNRDEFIPVKGGGNFKDKFISGLVPMDSGRLLVSTFNYKLYLLDTIQGTIDSTFVKPSLMEELVSARVIFLQSLEEDIYIGTREKGLFVLNDKWEVKEKFSMNEGLLDNTIPYFIFDSDPRGENALWIAHWKGISRVDINSPFRSVSVRSGVGDMYGRSEGELITDLEQFGGVLFVSTLDGLLQHQLNHEQIDDVLMIGIKM